MGGLVRSPLSRSRWLRAELDHSLQVVGQSRPNHLDLDLIKAPVSRPAQAMPLLRLREKPFHQRPLLLVPTKPEVVLGPRITVFDVAPLSAPNRLGNNPRSLAIEGQVHKIHQTVVTLVR